MTIHWQDPRWLYALIAVGALLGVGLLMWWRRYKGMARLLPGVRFSQFVSRSVVYALGVSAIVLALARPQWGFHWQERHARGSELMIAVDVSQSMMAGDVAPSRLEQARRALYDLSSIVDGDRMGIIAFAGVPFLLCPATTDMQALKLFIDMLDPALIPVQGTALADAIALALDSFNDTEALDTRAILLITDGEDHSGTLDAALNRAKEKGVRIFVVGIGSAEGAPIPLAEGGFKNDESGNLVLSRLRGDLLARIAAETGGQFIAVNRGALDLVSLYQGGYQDGYQGGIQSLVSEDEFGTQRERVYHERFVWPLLAGIALVALFPLLWKKNRTLVLLCALASAAPALAAEAPELYNLGNSAYSAKRYDEAQRYFERTLEQLPLGSETGKQALFNLGNTLYRQGNTAAALDAYETLLGIDPEHRPAQLNREFVERHQESQQNSDPESQEKSKENSQENAQENSQPQSTEPSDSERRAKRWLETVPEAQKILQEQVRKQIPVDKQFQKD